MNGKKLCMMISIIFINVFVVSGQLCAMDHVGSKNLSDSDSDKSTKIIIPGSREGSPGDSPDKSPEKIRRNSSPVIPRLSLDKERDAAKSSLQTTLNSQDKPKKKPSPIDKFSPQKFNPYSKNVSTNSSGDSFSASSKVVPKDKEHLVAMVKTFSTNTRGKDGNRETVLPKRRKIIEHDNIDAVPVVETASTKTMYSREDVIKILDKYDKEKEQEEGKERDEQLSSRLHEHGMKNGVKLKHLPHYGEMLQNIEVTPEIIAEYMHERHNVEQEKSKTCVQKNMEKMKEKDPDRYEGIVFTILKAIVDSQNGDSQSDTQLAGAHVDMLHQEIDNKDNAIFYRHVAIVVQAFIMLGEAAWAMYGQFSSSSEDNNVCNCTTIC